MTTDSHDFYRRFSVTVVGAGPAGLFAAELLAQAGCRVCVYDAMPSAGRKLLQAGRGGFNLTHSEPYDSFLQRYGQRSTVIKPWLAQFNADDYRQWAADLDIETYIGSSGRVYPKTMQAAPLLRSWLHRMKQTGVEFKMRHRWLGWHNNAIVMQNQSALQTIQSDAVLLALGGASWPRLGSDGAWLTPFSQAGIKVNPLLPANCGFNVNWSPVFAERFAGMPLKNLRISYQETSGQITDKLGEAMITANGLEGSLIYALSAGLRDQLLASNQALTIYLDLMPDTPLEVLTNKLNKAWAKKGKQSLSSFFKKAGLSAVQVGLLREKLTNLQINDMAEVAATLKQLPIDLLSTRPIDEVISSAGGVAFEALDNQLMLSNMPGVFCAGEMLDWEAPTGGYLLTAVMASGKVAAQGILQYLQQKQS